jgi:hypothetical protein
MDKINTDKLVKVYVKIRDARAELARKDRELEEQMDMISAQLLEVCKETGVDGLKTEHGTVTRRLSKRYWTSDWDSFYKFMAEHKAFHFLQQRISNSNVDTFLAENPDLHPPGLNSDASYTVVVRRSTK